MMHVVGAAALCIPCFCFSAISKWQVSPKAVGNALSLHFLTTLNASLKLWVQSVTIDPITEWLMVDDMSFTKVLIICQTFRCIDQHLFSVNLSVSKTIINLYVSVKCFRQVTPHIPSRWFSHFGARYYMSDLTYRCVCILYHGILWRQLLVLIKRKCCGYTDLNV